MEALPSPFQEALDARTAFAKSVTVTATRGDTRAVFDVESGSLTADARRAFRWSGSLSIPVDEEWIPTVPEDLLTPFGTTIDVRLGVVLASGATAEVPYGSFDLADSDVTLTPNARVVNLTLIDLAERLARYRFEAPFTTAAGIDLAATVILVVENRLGVTLDLADTGILLTRKRVFGMDPQLDPAREIIKLAADFGYRIYFDRASTLNLDTPPIADPATALLLGGPLVVTGAFQHRPANVVVVRGEASDGTAPVQAVAYDLDSNSPTYVGVDVGVAPYGRVTEFFASPLITTDSEAQQAAQSLLAKSAAQGATWTVAKPYDPTIDPDDVLTVTLDDETDLPLVVDAVTLNVGGQTTMQCRAISQLSEPTA